MVDLPSSGKVLRPKTAQDHTFQPLSRLNPNLESRGGFQSICVLKEPMRAHPHPQSKNIMRSKYLLHSNKRVAALAIASNKKITTLSGIYYIAEYVDMTHAVDKQLFPRYRFGFLFWRFRFWQLGFLWFRRRSGRYRVWKAGVHPRPTALWLCGLGGSTGPIS